jgi:hypothetical protein
VNVAVPPPAVAPICSVGLPSVRPLKMMPLAACMSVFTVSWLYV